jgi:hypothetical protein
MIKYWTWKRSKRKQNGLKAKVSTIGPFCFTQDTIEGVSDLGSIAELLRGELFRKRRSSCASRS